VRRAVEWVVARAALGLRGGRVEAPGRGAQLRRQGERAVARPQLRGAAACEPKASARGAARGKRAAPMLVAMTTRRSARITRGAPVMPLVALARQFASLSRCSRPCDDGIPARLARRRREPPRQRAGRGLGWEPRRRAQRSCGLRAARGGRAGGWVGGAPPAQRPRRGGNVQPRSRSGPTMRAANEGWAVDGAVTKTDSA